MTDGLSILFCTIALVYTVYLAVNLERVPKHKKQKSED